MTPERMIKILETVWLVIGIIAILFTVYAAIKQDWNQVIYFLVLTLAAGLMFYVRRRQRMRMGSGKK